MSACFGFGWVAAAAQTEPARQRAGGERVGGVCRRGVISLVARRDLRIGETRKHPRPLRLPHYSHVSAARTRGTLRVARTKDEIEQKISRASRRARVPTHTYTKGARPRALTYGETHYRQWHWRFLGFLFCFPQSVRSFFAAAAPPMQQLPLGSRRSGVRPRKNPLLLSVCVCAPALGFSLHIFHVSRAVCVFLAVMGIIWNLLRSRDKECC